MSIFSTTDYREAIKDLMAQQRRFDSKANFQHLAESIRVPKSYVSKVILGKANFNADQLYLIGKYFALSEESMHFVQLLLEFEKCSLAERRKLLLREIRQIQMAQLETKKNIKAKIVERKESGLEDYYLSPYNCIVHMALLLKRFQVDQNTLHKEIGLPEKIVAESMKTLNRLGIIEFTPKGLIVRSDTIHLPKDSLLFKAWNSQMRLISQQQLIQAESDQYYSVSVTLSASEEDRLKLQGLFINFLKQAELISQKKDTQRILQLNFDLFAWI
jgi:uncharacterized protein (TIGR02147 family)